ncbi:hypothetical protein MPTK1_7g02350 [Marchantia polymorpha subsp. ruderalis]|uniref:YDG domain-containing protein n=2 Tax=Marchantia polymorpha TaxID=3197 RepID=A0AAF6BVD1_MARPO|nr:hypothetical protein MARPO_0088s0051 [Marchantia polymorpha]BBN15965.1 hypothetical protein Mp_7g02350 [Marchantia polymorpha subsp. ruderalis]|eukprot:PTQ33505.1 hypothetical protein MARPO_0088s0051 [Marchantia polymorpha]
MGDQVDTSNEYEENPYFQILSRTQRSSSAGRGIKDVQRQSREKPRAKISRSKSSMSNTSSTASQYQEILGRDVGSYCWFRPEQKRVDETDSEEVPGETSSSSIKACSDSRSAFLEKTRAWMQKYVSDRQGTPPITRTVDSDEISSAIVPSAETSVSTKALKKPGVTTSTLPQTYLKEKMPEDQTSELEMSPDDHKPAEDKDKDPVGPRRELVKDTLERRELAEDKDKDPVGPRRELVKDTLERRELVKDTLETFQRIWEFMENEAEDVTPKRRRSDMRVAAKMRESKLTLEEDIIGEVEGVEVGDTFSWRAEMAVIGLHKELVAGINVVKRSESEGGPIATSVVFGAASSYSDNIYQDSSTDRCVYSGEGGLPSKSKDSTGYRDQTLTGGNLALKRTADQKIPLRVIRGLKKVERKDDRKYIYDGLYEIIAYQYDTGVNGNKVYKFVLERLPGQRPLP